VPLRPPQISHLAWDRTRATAVGSRRQTASAMARPLPTEDIFCNSSSCFICVTLISLTSVSTNKCIQTLHIIHLWLHSPFLGPWPLFSFLIFYTIGMTPWTGDQPVARPLPTHRTNAHRHPCLECDSNPRSQCLSARRRFIPQTARPL
jgi:hypothetical protein